MDCLKEEMKPILPIKSLDVIFRRRNVPNSQYYFANRKHAVTEDVTKKKLQPYRVPKSEKLLSYIKYSDRKEKLIAQARLAQPLHLKDNLRIAATRDMSERLFIKEPIDDVRAVVEIHPEFYSVIEGRPLRCFDDIKVYINNIRNYAMNRQQIGYRRDLIMKIDKGLIDETEEHDKIVVLLKAHIKNFQKFLTEDYNRACNRVMKSEKTYAELVAKNSEFLGYVSKVTILNNIIFKLDAIRSILKTYRSFLLFVAPLPWREMYDERLKNVVQVPKTKDVFVTDNDLVDAMDLNKIIEAAKQELQNPYPAHLYFRFPRQIIFLFRTMELQSREYLIHHSKTDVPFHRLQERIKLLKAVTKRELDYYEYYIESINREIIRENYNEQHLQQKFFRILNTMFYETIASPDSLKLKICIEYVYEQIFGKCEEGHQSLQDPMKILEIMYEDYNLRLDSLDFKIVNQARTAFFAQDLKIMRNAYKAERELKAFREMTNAINKAFLAPKPYKRPVITKFKSEESKDATAETGESTQEEKVKPKFVRPLTKEERDGLIFFTEWCEGTDPGPYLAQYYQYVKTAFEWVPRKSTAF